MTQKKKISLLLTLRMIITGSTTRTHDTCIVSCADPIAEKNQERQTNTIIHMVIEESNDCCNVRVPWCQINAVAAGAGARCIKSMAGVDCKKQHAANKTCLALIDLRKTGCGWHFKATHLAWRKLVTDCTFFFYDWGVASVVVCPCGK